jgi:hypothetical protein
MAESNLEVMFAAMLLFTTSCSLLAAAGSSDPLVVFVKQGLAADAPPFYKTITSALGAPTAGKALTVYVCAGGCVLAWLQAG